MLFRSQLFQHFTVGNGFGFVQFLGLELEVTGLLLEFKLQFSLGQTF